MAVGAAVRVAVAEAGPAVRVGVPVPLDWGALGERGALLRVLSGVLLATGGRAVLDPRVGLQATTSKIRIGIKYQQPAWRMG